MKTAVISAVLAAAVAASVSYAQTGHGQSGQAPIVVSGERLTLARWSGAFAKNLDRHLRYPSSDFRSVPMSGVVSISFTCSEDGSPAAVAVSRKSGWSELDRAALRAVSRIKTLHPMPASFKADQKFRANILFATSQDDHDRQIKRLRRQAESGNAWFKDDPDVIALNIGSRARARS